MLPATPVPGIALKTVDAPVYRCHQFSILIKLGGQCFFVFLRPPIFVRKAGLSLRVLIDADGCPVVDHAIRIAQRFGIPVLLLCDTAHAFSRPGARTVTVSKGADSVDFALVNLLQPGDAVVTQDYGLAAMCLARGAFPIHQDGKRYTAENIDALLLTRHTAKQIRRAGGRLKGPSKRTEEQDRAFEKAFTQLLETQQKKETNTDEDLV